jgi:hypothetical protein
MFASSTHRYDIMLDFADDILPDWEPVESALTTPSTSRSPSPEPAANRIYDGMAGVFTSKEPEEFALEYAGVATYILDNTKECMQFLIDHAPIRNALRDMSKKVQDKWPAAITITMEMLALLDIIKMDHPE